MIDWDRVRTVLLDMDGTLLDLHFDNVFWLQHVPSRYAEERGLTVEQARAEIVPRMKAVEGTIDWYCLDYWARELALDVVALKREIEHLIRFREGAEAFLASLAAAGKRRVLVTNAHQDSLSIKLERTALENHVERIISAHEFGLSKEHPDFWESLRATEPFDPETTLLLDDSVGVLRSAANYGLGQVVGVRRPDSQQPPREPAGFPMVESFAAVSPR